MKRYLCVFGILGISMLQNNLFAQDSAKPVARELLSMAVNPSFDYSRQGRTKFIGVLAAYCTEILQTLPSNTPNEDAWVISEANTSDDAKIERLFSSKEWSRHELKSTFENCRESTAKIVTAQKFPEKTDNVVRYEAAQLISLAVNFNDGNDIAKYATRAGLGSATWRLEFIGTIRRALLVAALRTLEGK